MLTHEAVGIISGTNDPVWSADCIKDTWLFSEKEGNQRKIETPPDVLLTGAWKTWQLLFSFCLLYYIKSLLNKRQ